MSIENDNDHACAVWQGQDATSARLAPDEIRKRVEQMEKKMRRSTYGLYLAVMLSSFTIIGIAILFSHPVLIIGAALTVCGLGYIAYEVRHSRRSAPSVDDGSWTSVGYHRALLQRRRDFHRKRLWLRILSLAPGGILFFAGFAAAQPRLAPFIYVQLATFILAIILIIPMNRQAAMRLQHEIDELDRLG